MPTASELVGRLREYATKFVAANGEPTSGTLLASEAAVEIERLEAERDEARRDLYLTRNQRDNLADNLHRAEAQRDQLAEALRTLVERLAVVHDDPRYIGVWTLAQLHSRPYDGPTYTDELVAAHAALAALEPKP